jgi:3-oxoacid CoA-transferase subunit A/glutaconate CoA-transferase subunit A
MTEWLTLSRTDEGVRQYFEKYVYSIENFKEYLKLIGGDRKLRYLRRLEFLKVPLVAPWARRNNL